MSDLDEVLRLDGEIKALERELAAVEKASAARVDARVGLVLEAQRAGLHVDASWSDVAIMRAVVGLLNPSARLDGAEDDYVAGVYAFTIEPWSPKPPNTDRLRDVSEPGAASKTNRFRRSKTGRKVRP
jgi:hypothetical protein